jgi:histone-lysine N-methyltransferase SETMAR
MKMSQLTKIEYRAVIKFLTKEGHTPNQIKQRLDGVYGDLSPSYSTVKKWAKCFRLGQESLEDDERSGRPTEVITPQKIAIIEEMVLEDRRLKVKEEVLMPNISETSIRRILHDHLGMNKISARWVPRLLSALQRQRRVECARSFLNMCGDDPKPILESIVTGDETMVVFYDPLSKRESMERGRPDVQVRPQKGYQCEHRNTQKTLDLFHCLLENSNTCFGMLCHFQRVFTTESNLYIGLYLYLSLVRYWLIDLLVVVLKLNL